jgi:hypothetical protein
VHLLHCAENVHRLDKDEEYDRLLKLRAVLDSLKEAFAKFFKTSEHLAVDAVIVKCKGSVTFRQYIPKEMKGLHQNL